MSYEFEDAMKVLREKANMGAYAGQASMRVPLSMLLGILGRAEKWPELARLRAVNADLVEAIRSLRPVIEKIHGLSEAVDAALSRAEQAKMEPETCVWTYEAAWVSGCGLQYINAVIDADMQFCPLCGKRIEVKK